MYRNNLSRVAPFHQHSNTYHYDIVRDGKIETVEYITIKLAGEMEVFINCNRGVLLKDNNNKIMVAISPDGTSAGIVTPDSLMYQHNKTNEVMIKCADGSCKFAVTDNDDWGTFTSDRLQLEYVLEPEGNTRPPTGNFMDLVAGDFCSLIFGGQADTYRQFYPLNLNNFYHKENNDNSEIFRCDDLKITRDTAGIFLFRQDRGDFHIGVGYNGFILLNTPNVYATASPYKTNDSGSIGGHFYARRGPANIRFNSFNQTMTLQLHNRVVQLDASDSLRIVK